MLVMGVSHAALRPPVERAEIAASLFASRLAKKGAWFSILY